MKFPTAFCPNRNFRSRRGKRFKNEYQLFVEEDGREELKIVGETDLHAYIQSFRDLVDLDLIIARYTAGDEEALRRAEAFYADVTSTPNNLQDLMNLNIRGEQYFKTLPEEIRNLYEDNYLQMLMHPEKLVEYAKSKNVEQEPAKEPKHAKTEEVTADEQ